MNGLEQIIEEIRKCDVEMVGCGSLYSDEKSNSIVVDLGWQDWRDHRALKFAMDNFFVSHGIEYAPNEDIYEEDGSDGYAAKHIFTLAAKIEDDVLVKYLFNSVNVVIPNDIKKIGDYAFGRYIGRKLETVKLPDSLVEIGKGAFAGCEALIQVDIPKNTKLIGDYAFSECRRLSRVSLPKSIDIIGQGAFDCCGSLTNISCEEDNPSFYSDKGCLIQKNDSGNVLIRCFEGQTIPDNISVIGKGSFSGRNDVMKIVIPDNVTDIESGAFSDCLGLSEIVIPEGIIKIDTGVFRRCSNLTKIILPSTLGEIGNSAFAGCTSLTSISVPTGVITIGSDAFSGCTSLSSILIPASTTVIGDSAFFYCSSLTEISIPAGVTSIGKYTFSGCTSLSNILIPASVTSIGENAFSGCSNLTEISFSEKIKAIDGSAFSKCGSLSSISCAKGNSTFRVEGNCLLKKNCLVLGCKSSIIPTCVTSIGDYAFEGRCGLTSIEIPNTVTKIGNCAFDECSDLRSITIPESVNKIGYYLVSGDTVIKTVSGSTAAKYAKRNGIKVEETKF